MLVLVLLGIVAVYLLIRKNLIVVETRNQKIVAYGAGALVGVVLSFVPWTLILIVALVVWLYFKKK